MRVTPSGTPRAFHSWRYASDARVERERAGDRAGGGVGLFAGRAEQDMDRIADDLGDRALVREHDFRHAFEIAAEQARELLWDRAIPPAA